MFFLSAPDHEILDRKMQQPLKSINTSFISCLTTTDIRTDWFFAFSRLECWLCLNHKCALDDGILDKKMQRPLKPTTLFVGKLCRGAEWQCHCLAVIIIIITIITNIIIDCLAPLCIVSRDQISCPGSSDLFCFCDHQSPPLFHRSIDWNSDLFF